MSGYHAKIAGPRWERVRRQVLNSANWQCWCGKYAKEVDHILPLSLGGQPFDLENLQVLCKFHHRLKSDGEKPNPVPGRAEWREYVKNMANDIIK